MPDTFKLVLARSAVVNGYTSQWINAVCKDLAVMSNLREPSLNFCGDYKLKLDGSVPCIKACMIEPRTDR